MTCVGFLSLYENIIGYFGMLVICEICSYTIPTKKTQRKKITSNKSNPTTK